MDKLIGEIGTSYFWLTLLAIPYLLGLLTNYSVRPIDAAAGKISKRWKDRAGKKWAAIERATKELDDPEYRAYLRWLSHLYGQRLVAYLIMALAGWALALGMIFLGLPLVVETVPRWQGFTMLALFSVLGIYCSYVSVRFDRVIRTHQTMLELWEDRRQIVRDANVEDEAANAKLDTAKS